MKIIFTQSVTSTPMKTKKLLKILGLCAVLATVLASPLSGAQSSFDFEFVPFKLGDVNNQDLEFININLHLVDVGTGVQMYISNRSVIGEGWVTSQRPAVANIYFDGNSSFFPAIPTIGDSSPEADFQVEFSPSNLPGGSEIGFDADFALNATPPPTKNGMNPGEFIRCDVAGADYATVLAGLESGDIRIGLHIISAGSNGADSFSFLNSPVPEPSAALLGSLGAMLLFRRRR